MIRPHFSQLSESDRWVMDSMLAEGHSQASVARSIGVHPSTICRERKRGLLPGCDRYFAVVGERRRVAARARSGLSRRKLGTDRNSPYWQLV